MSPPMRTRWAAVGAAVAVTLGAGGIGLVAATSPGGAATFVPIEPCRVVDTRPAPNTVGNKTSPVGPEEVLVVAAHGNNGQCVGIPAAATGLVLNVTAVGATELTFLTLWGDGDRPHASHLNPAPGQPPTPNAVTTDLTNEGEFNVYNRFGSVNVLADIVGYYTDHHHDDRYYTRAQSDAALAGRATATQVAALRTETIRVGRYAAQTTGNDGLGFGAGCAANATDSSTLHLPLTIPIGASIDRVTAVVFDVGADIAFTVRLQRVADAVIFPLLSPNTVASATGGTDGGVSKIVEVELELPGPVVVPPDDFFEIAFLPGGQSGNAICSVAVTYTRPAVD